MAKLYYVCEPFDKNAITLALESGVDGIICAQSCVESVTKLARCEVIPLESVTMLDLKQKEDEETIAKSVRSGAITCIRVGWEIIPIENLLAQNLNFCVEAQNAKEAKLATGILERGVEKVFLLPQTIADIKTIISECKIQQNSEILLPATVTKISPVGLGHRVCVDSMSLLHKGQGMLIGNSSAFTFLVHAETEHNEYVAARPFRINAGGVHAYVRLPNDRTSYLSELKAGKEILVCDYQGKTSLATIGRVKIEVRPMLLIEAEVETEGKKIRGSVFLQNAETIRLTTPEGEPVSVVSLSVGDTVLCRIDKAGRHFGMRITEDIKEV